MWRTCASVRSYVFIFKIIRPSLKRLVLTKFVPCALFNLQRLFERVGTKWLFQNVYFSGFSSSVFSFLCCVQLFAFFFFSSILNHCHSVDHPTMGLYIFMIFFTVVNVSLDELWMLIGLQIWKGGLNCSVYILWVLGKKKIVHLIFGYCSSLAFKWLVLTE